MYNVIVIGSGPAGISASIYLKRADLNVLVISNQKSALNRAEKIENYYGQEKPISGKELLNKGLQQARNLKIDIIEKEVIGIKYLQQGFEIVTANQGKDEQYNAQYVIIATGANRKQPSIKGISKFQGKGVSYCATCDAYFYKNKDVGVIGNGEYALGEIDELLPLANKVTMFTDGKEPIQKRDDILINENKIEEVRGTEKLEEIKFEDGKSEKIDGLFIAEGIATSVDLAKKVGARIENNTIAVNSEMETTIPNLYACGDCTGGILQVSKAVYDGTRAGLAIIKKIRS